MATGMFGANPEELDAVGNSFGAAGGVVTTAEVTSGTAVAGVIWFGIDATMFKANYQATVCTQLNLLTATCEEVDGRLQQQAAEQVDCSSPGGNGGGGMSLLEMLKKAWTVFTAPLKLFKAARFAAEAWTLATNPFLRQAVLGMGHSYKGFLGLESLLKEVSPAYSFMNDMTDRLQFKKFSTGLEHKIGGWVDDAFRGGSEALEQLGKSSTAQKIADFVGKEGRLVGKGMSVFGAALDLGMAAQHFSNGNTGQGTYSLVKAGLGAATLIPGPIGWAAGGASLACAAYDNIPIVKNTVNAAAGAVADTAKSLWPF